MKSYGQAAVFDHFVRNRHSWNSPFTDSMPIFIDLSVNESDFDKYSTRSISMSRSYYGQSVIWELFVRNRHSWNSPFTDSMPIFIDLSVNDSVFAE